MEHRTSAFQGVKANTGFAIHTTESGQSILTLSDDCKIPDAPKPHWQVVDSKGNVYLLQMLKVKGDKINGRIVGPYRSDCTLFTLPTRPSGCRSSLGPGEAPAGVVSQAAHRRPERHCV